jgi:predicted dehydrogenase
MIRLALIGCGKHSENAHAKTLAQYSSDHPGRIQLLAACDVNLTRAQYFVDQYGFSRAYDNSDKMLEMEKPDGVLCILPVPLIVENSIELLERGIPTVIEKPLGETIEDAERLANVAKRTGTRHMVSVNRRFVPRLNRAIQWAREHGPLQYVRCSMFRHARNEDSFIFGTGIHTVDAMRHIAGDVSTHSLQVIHGQRLTSRWHLVDLAFTTGTRGRLDILTTTGSHSETYELFGENYRIELFTRLPSETTSVLRCWQNDQLVLEDRSATDEPGSIARGEYHELNEFVTALEENRPMRPTVMDVLPSMKLCLDLYDEARAQTGQS